MANYKIMYYQLFNAVTQAINILEDAQKRSENDFIEDASNYSGTIKNVVSNSNTKNIS